MTAARGGKDSRSLLCEAPSRPFRQKTPGVFSAVGLCVAALAVGWAVAAGEADRPKSKARASGTIVHSVYFWLQDGATDKDVATLIADCKKLLGPLPCVKRLDVGVPLGKSRGVVDSSYQVGLVVTFDDQAGYDTYVKHPDHLKLIARHKALWKKVLVYDFVRK